MLRSHLPPDPAENERRRAALEDDQDKAADLHAVLERAAEQSSVAYSDPAVHRLAGRERRRRWSDDPDAA